MANKDKLTDLMKRAAPFITGLAGDVNEETVGADIEALLLALETHKNSADHDNDPHTWTMANIFTQLLRAATIVPSVSDTHDLGNETLLWRKGWFSELATFRLTEYEQCVMDGWFIVCKQSGTFPADVAASDTAIDFGRVMTVGDYVMLRSTGKVEYMKILSQTATANVYNVTRNLDGSGANNWPAGSVYAVRGKNGDGWLELTASGGLRMSVFTQGVNWNSNKEVVRIGKLDGWQGSTLTGFGVVSGDFAANEYMYYNTITNKFSVSGVVSAYNGAATLNQFGLNAIGIGSGLNIYHNPPPAVPKATVKLSFDPGNPSNNWLDIKCDSRISILAGLLNPTKIEVNPINVEINKNVSINGNIAATNITVGSAANNIPLADANGKIDAGWIPALSYAPRQEMVGLKRTTAQSIPRAAWTSIIWNSEDYDTFNFWTSGSAVHAYNAGVYNISAYAGTSGMASGLFTVGIFINSESVPRLQQNASVYSGGIHILLSGALKLESGDIVYVKIYHDNATALSTLTSQPSRLHLCWISN